MSKRKLSIEIDENVYLMLAKLLKTKQNTLENLVNTSDIENNIKLAFTNYYLTIDPVGFIDHSAKSKVQKEIDNWNKLRHSFTSLELKEPKELDIEQQDYKLEKGK